MSRGRNRRRTGGHRLYYLLTVLSIVLLLSFTTASVLVAADSGSGPAPTVSPSGPTASPVPWPTSMPQATTAPGPTPGPSTVPMPTAMPTPEPTPSPTPAPLFAPASPTPSPSPTPDPSDNLTKLCQAIENYQSTVTLTNITIPEYEEIMDTIWYDRPQYFWLGAAWSYTPIGSDIRLDLTWEYTGDIDLMRHQVESMADSVLRNMPKDLDDYGKAVYIHDWLCDHIEYTYSEDRTDQNIYGALVEGKCVCAGYTRAYDYLLEMAGVESTYVPGDAGGPHAWSRVTLEGETYYTDVTWDDHDGGGFDYDWFNLTSDLIGRSHTPDDPSFMPYTNANTLNYHVKNGWRLYSYDEQELARIFSTQTGNTLTLSCADEATYKKVVDLVGRSDIYPLLSTAGHNCNGLSYSVDERVFTVNLYLS